MKRKLLIFVLAMFCLMLTVLGSAAYYTHDVKTHNVISSGNVKVKLVELDEDGNDFENISGAMPGQSYAKVVMAENTGAAEAWIRVKLKVSALPAWGVFERLDTSLIELVVDDENWVEQDGWYYYKQALQPGEKTLPLMSSVAFAPEMGNQWQNASLIIDVYVQAVQTANNGSTVFEAKGWPAGWIGGFWP